MGGSAGVIFGINLVCSLPKFIIVLTRTLRHAHLNAAVLRALTAKINGGNGGDNFGRNSDGEVFGQHRATTRVGGGDGIGARGQIIKITLIVAGADTGKRVSAGDSKINRMRPASPLYIHINASFSISTVGAVCLGIVIPLNRTYGFDGDGLGNVTGAQEGGIITVIAELDRVGAG